METDLSSLIILATILFHSGLTNISQTISHKMSPSPRYRTIQGQIHHVHGAVGKRHIDTYETSGHLILTAGPKHQRAPEQT